MLLLPLMPLLLLLMLPLLKFLPLPQLPRVRPLQLPMPPLLLPILLPVRLLQLLMLLLQPPLLLHNNPYLYLYILYIYAKKQDTRYPAFCFSVRQTICTNGQPSEKHGRLYLFRRSYFECQP